MRLVLSILLLIGLWGCNCKTKLPQKGNINLMTSDIIPFKSDSIKIEGDLNGFQVELRSQQLENGLEIIHLKMTNSRAATPPKFTLKWSFPSIDIAKFWTPNFGVNKANYYQVNLNSRSTRLAPVISFMNTNDENRFTFAIADALQKVQSSAYIMEEDARFHCEVVFFDEKHPKIKNYETEIIIDRRKKPFYKSLTNITDWWAQHDGYSPATPPSNAFLPVYSTWYSYHQNLDVDAIIEECKTSKQMGIETLIVDDGWQTMDNKRGYAYTGDWKPERIPEMKEFVDRVHKIGMKFMLWYSVPFIGKEAKNFDQFKGKYLYNWESQGTWVLDPRYPKVREFIISTYEKAIEDWGLDGLKLDFMGFFGPRKNTEFTANNGRDYASINQAVDVLMSDIMTRLKQVNPDILIEFRQPYIGPLMRKYGNMLRAADCPNMATINRVRVTDTRLLAGQSAVHSDMLMWHPNDPVEHAALQILNIIFSVPQISVTFNKIPEEHQEMIAYWMNYCNTNRDVLLKGEFQPQMPDHLYPLIKSIGKDKAIIAVYDQVFIKTSSFGELPAFDVINARNSKSLVLLNSVDLGIYQADVYNYKGDHISSQKIELTRGAQVFYVPPSGLIQLNKL